MKALGTSQMAMFCINNTCEEKGLYTDHRRAHLIFTLVNALFVTVGTTMTFDVATMFWFQIMRYCQADHFCSHIMVKGLTPCMTL